MKQPRIGVCYYPEQWPIDVWQRDAERMAALGLSVVRIGEFAWSRIEPEPGLIRIDWLEKAIETLATAGLEVVLGTPTATPPKWLVDALPDMHGVDLNGNRRGFGSRRHYCFSHQGYREECRRIVTLLAEQFGQHEALIGWQTDNEYGCHDSTLSFSYASLSAFRDWLIRKYGVIAKLNESWGNVFWSMEYNSFEQIELPNGTVTAANPAHWLDFRRFSSDQVVSFNRLQADIIRKLSPGRDVIHNFMGRVLEFDHYDVGADLDVSSWDAYPLGFLEDRVGATDERKAQFARAGDPDFQAFHHDLYRGTSDGRWWIMEQQPGPVNWAEYNPAPRNGMVRLWSLEAFAHGAEVVSYFRWRQIPFAQEQMHAGLLRPDDIEAPAFQEIVRVMEDIESLPQVALARADVAIVFDYTSAWAWNIQPQGREFDYFQLVFQYYRGLRRLGFSVDIINAKTESFGDYQIVLIPGLFAWTEPLRRALDKFDGVALLGPRTGSKTATFTIPDNLPPDLPGSIFDGRISHVESLRPNSTMSVDDVGGFTGWREFAECGDRCHVELRCADGEVALIRQNSLYYLFGWPDEPLLDHVLCQLMDHAGLPIHAMPEGVRMRRAGEYSFLFNYGEEPFDTSALELGGTVIIGERFMQPSEVLVLHGAF